MDLNCRVCLQVHEVMVNIFEEVEQFETDLATLLETCGGMEVQQDDSFPKHLCQECIQQLLGVAEFREKCKLATKYLMEMQQKAAEEYTTVEQIDEAILTTEHDQKEDSPTESTLVYEPLIVDDDNNELYLTECSEVEHDNLTKLDAVHINIVFDNDQNNIGAIQNSTNNVSNSLENVIQLVLPKDEHTFSDKNSTEVTAIESNSDNYLKVDESVENFNDFADYIIEELENEDSEIKVESENQETETKAERPTTSLHSTENYSYVCEACGASFVKSLNLRRHMEIGHKASLKFFCEKCDRSFMVESDYKRHIEMYCEVIQKLNNSSLTKNSESKKKTTPSTNKFTCDHCGKCLQSLFSLRTHIRTHTGERPFSCDSCESQFKTQAALNAHRKRHTGNADLICEICEKRFYDPSNLIAHRRTHTGERPHTCNVCNKSFARVYLLQLHMRTHTGERPYQCEHCQKSFSQSADLKYHLATHNGERKFACSLCPKTFIRRNKLDLHMEKHIMQPTLQAMQDNTALTNNEDNSEFFTNFDSQLDVCDLNVKESFE